MSKTTTVPELFNIYQILMLNRKAKTPKTVMFNSVYLDQWEPELKTVAELIQFLKDTVCRLYDNGYRDFECYLKTDFEFLAAQIVLEYKKEHLDIVLVGTMPY